MWLNCMRIANMKLICYLKLKNWKVISMKKLQISPVLHTLQGKPALIQRTRRSFSYWVTAVFSLINWSLTLFHPRSPILVWSNKNGFFSTYNRRVMRKQSFLHRTIFLLYSTIRYFLVCFAWFSQFKMRKKKS